MNNYATPIHSHLHRRTLIFGLILTLLFSNLSLVAKPVFADFETQECAAPDPAWLFCDDFEQDRSAQYRTPFSTPPAKLYRQTGTGLDGSNALTSEFVGSPSVGMLSLAFGKTPNAATYKPVGDTNEVYRDFFWRTYVKNDSSWTVGEGGTFAQFFAYGTSDQVLAKAELRYSYGRLYVDLYPATFDVNGNPTGPAASPTFVDSANRPKILGLGAANVGNWNRVEVRIKQNDAGQSNGVFQLWVNDSLEINKSDINWLGSYGTYGFNVVNLTNNLGASGIPTQYRYHDNMVLSEEPIGTAAAPSPTPTTTVTPTPTPTSTPTPTPTPASTPTTTPSSTLIFADNFDAYTDSPRNHGWGEVSNTFISIQPTDGPDGSHAVRASYQGPNNVAWLRYPVGQLNLNEVFVDFDFKVDEIKGGSKFLKLFGKTNSPQGYANSTFALTADAPPRLNAIAYGNGTAIENDTNTIIGYNGNTNDSYAIIEKKTSPLVPESHRWYNYKAYMRYNTDGNRDGEYIVWVDGEVRIHATNIKNRNDLNSREFYSVDLANVTSSIAEPWNLWYDNVEIHRGIPANLRTELAAVNAQLESLTVGTGTLSPAFASSQITYSVDLPAAATSLDLTAVLKESGATMAINGQPVGSGQSATVPVGVNDTQAIVSITAPNGVTTKTYTINLKRPAVVNECGNPQAGWLFCDDFGIDQMSKYYDYFKRWGRFQRGGKGIDGSQGMVSFYGFYSGDVTAGAATPPHGTWMKLGVGKTPDNAAYKPIGDGNTAERELYWRFYVRNNTIVPGNTNISSGPLARVYGYGPGNIPFMQIDVNYPDSSGVLVSELRTGTFSGNGAPTGTTLADTLTGTTPIMAANQAGPWRLVEIRAKLNDPGQTNGVYQLWIDGQLESSKTGINWVGSYTEYGINALELYNTNNQPGVPGGDNEYRVFDNLIVSRTPVGEPGLVSLVNANLSNIAPGAGKLSPAFHANKTAYTLTVEHGVSSTNVMPVLADDQAALKVNGIPYTTGTAVALTGAAPLTIEVTARDGMTTKTYTVSLAQAAPFFVNECSNIQSDWLFCDDYEVNRMNQYFERTSQNQFYRTTDVGLGSSSGMKAEYRQADGAEHDTGAIKLAFGRTPSTYLKPIAAQGEDLREVYFRFYVKNQDGWIGGGGDKLARLSSMQSENWAQSMIAHVWSGNGAGKNQLVAEPARGTDAAGNLLSTKWNDWPNLYWFGGQTSTTPIYDEDHVGNWYAIETRVKLNDPGQSNGVFQVWIDDELQMSRTDLNYIGSYEIGPGKGYGLNWLALENYWNAGTPQDQERYFDNLVVSRSKIGLAIAPTESVPALTANIESGRVGDDLELTIAVPDTNVSFNAADFIVHYDPQRIEFETVTQDSTTVLAESAFESLLPGFAVASAVKHELGQLRVLLASTSSAASGGQPIFKLHGKLKNDAPTGNAQIVLNKLELSLGGIGTNIDVSGASVSVEVSLADKAALQALIASAQQTHNAAVVGTGPGQYPANAKQALQTAINAAATVITDANATQTQVNAAVSALQAAVAAFANSVIPAVAADFTALDSAIATAQAKHAAVVEGTKLGQYAAGSKSTLQTAIAAAQNVRAQASASQSTVDQATAALQTAKQTFAHAIVTLVPGAASITIHDLSIVAQHYGATSSDSDWAQIAAADIFNQGEITLEALAAIAQMILNDWAAE